MYDREGDTNLGLAEEFCASVIEASEGKTGVHLINVSVKGIREAALRKLSQTSSSSRSPS